MAKVVSVNDEILMPGTIGLAPISGEVGRIIRFGQWIVSHPVSRWLARDTQPNFQHAFVYLGDGKLIEAEPGGARIRNISEYPAAYYLTHIANAFGVEKLEKAAVAASNFYKVPYSFIDYLAIAARRLHIPVPGLREYINDSGHVICSQLAATAYLRAGLAIYPKALWPGYVDPMDLYYLDLKYARVSHW